MWQEVKKIIVLFSFLKGIQRIKLYFSVKFTDTLLGIVVYVKLIF